MPNAGVELSTGIKMVPSIAHPPSNEGPQTPAREILNMVSSPIFWGGGATINCRPAPSILGYPKVPLFREARMVFLQRAAGG